MNGFVLLVSVRAPEAFCPFSVPAVCPESRGTQTSAPVETVSASSLLLFISLLGTPYRCSNLEGQVLHTNSNPETVSSNFDLRPQRIFWRYGPQTFSSSKDSILPLPDVHTNTSYIASGHASPSAYQ